MSYNWGPYYIVPTDFLKTYSGTVVLREEFDEDLLYKEIQALGLSGPIETISNPWYYRKKDTDTWLKIGESTNEQQNFPTQWDTTALENGQYEVMGLMHVFAKKGNADVVIARQNVVEVIVKN
jgi:hypothetical protein